jgi:uncharacterized OB-fold protein
MSESTLPTPNPTVTVDTVEFWDGLKDGKFLLRRCDSCQTVIWYPRKFCPNCGSIESTWFESSGKGSIYTYTIVHRSMLPDWAASGPYVIAYVELEEGPRIMTNIVNIDPESVTVGAPVQVVYTTTDDGSALYRFEPAG